MSAIAAGNSHFPYCISTTLRPFFRPITDWIPPTITPNGLPSPKPNFWDHPWPYMQSPPTMSSYPMAILSLHDHFLAGRRPDFVRHHHHHMPYSPLCQSRLAVALVVPPSTFFRDRHWWSVWCSFALFTYAYSRTPVFVYQPEPCSPTHQFACRVCVCVP